jgi:hypothetical protein
MPTRKHSAPVSGTINIKCTLVYHESAPNIYFIVEIYIFSSLILKIAVFHS